MYALCQQLFDIYDMLFKCDTIWPKIVFWVTFSCQIYLNFANCGVKFR